MMEVRYAPNFKERLAGFQPQIKKKFEKQIEFLIHNIRHPSLHAKKYDESSGLWQFRVDKNVRCYFRIENDVCYLTDITNHPK